MNLSHIIKICCQTAIQAAYPAQYPNLDPNVIEVTAATNAQFGHYQCNSAMKLAKILSDKPRSIAEKILDKLNDLKEGKKDKESRNDEIFSNHILPHDTFSKIDIAGPGFINFTFSPHFLSAIISEQLHDPMLGVDLKAFNQSSRPQKIVIDLSSPNTAKEMHVGHLRSTILGDCFARIYRFLEQDVLPLNHVGDWGTQFGMLIAYIKDVFPNIIEDEKKMHEISVSDLMQYYRASKQRFDEEPLFKKKAQLEVVALQNGDPHSLQAWKTICSISRTANQHIYDLLEIELIERGESFFNPYLPALIESLEKKGLVTVSDGAKCIYLEGFNNRDGEPLPLILQKADGGYNYSTTDLASLEYRVSVDRADSILYVVDAGQSLHFQMVFEAARKAGLYDPSKVKAVHVGFGFVLRSDGKKFKTRSGETERLIDLIQTAIDRAKTALVERQVDLSEVELENSAKILGINAIKYADLSCHRTSDYVFSYDKMLRFEGNTAAFLLYAYVRIQSIQRKTQGIVTDLFNQKNKIILDHPEEIALGLLVCQFNEILTETLADYAPSKLTDYLYRLAERFHSFFHHCRVEGSSEQNSRLLLCEAVAQVLRQGFTLLGLKPLERM